MSSTRSLGAKFVVRIAGICLVAVALASGTAMVWTSLHSRFTLASHLEQLADVVGRNGAEALRRGDAGAAEAVLRALQDAPSVGQARLTTADGRVLASYADVPVDDEASPAAAWPFGPIRVTRPIISASGDASPGDITLESTLWAARSPFVVDLPILLAAAVLAGLVGVVLARRASDELLSPVLTLPHTLKNVMARGDFRLRAERPDDPELAATVDQFNDLLARIEKHDQELAAVRRQAEQDVRDQTEQFRVGSRAHREEAKELILARAAAEESSMAKSTFLFNMSHELRTPLNAIMGYSEILKEDAEDEGATQHVTDLNKILAAGRHLLTLITDVLDLSKIEAGRMELAVEDIDVAALVADIASTSETLAARQNNVLSLKPLGDLGRMRTDPTKVRQILINLLGNACKFTSDGYVVVEAFREQEMADWIVLKVHDTGIGMSAEEVASLFREFSQGHVTQKPREGGSGLGLAISQGLCQLLGGVISVESQAGVGSTFTVRLPAELPTNPGQRVRRALPPAGFGRQTNDADDADKPALLVVDDDADARELVGRVASRLGHRLIEATNADEGLRLALEHEPVAIVLETVLPAQNGWRLLERLKGIRMLDHVPVVVVSVSDDEPRSRSLGATAHLGKPVPTEQLTRTLRDLSRDTPVAEPAGAAG